MNRMGFRYILAMLFAVLWSAAAAVVSPDEAIQGFLLSKGITPEKTAVMITDLENGAVIVAHNEGLPLIPASIMKAVTSAALLEKCGPDHRYVTDVYTDGRISDGTLEGNLVIIGSGDPTIGTDREPLPEDFIAEIIEKLKSRGVRKIDGEILIDTSCFTGPAVPPSWASGDLKTYYGTGVHGFNFERNASGNRSVSNPPAIFKSRLKSRLSLAGIQVSDAKSEGGKRTLLLSHLSPPMEDIMRSCMMRSDNMYAETLLRTFGLLSGGSGDVAGSARLETESWKRAKAPMEGVEIIDGSGLSRSNRMTAKFMEHVLHRMRDNVEYASLFPLAGQEGTLKKFLAGTELEAYLAMKTGSMNGIQCYAGYVLDDDFAPTHAVVFIMNSLKDRNEARRAAETLLLRLFAKNQSDSEQEDS